MNVVTYLFGILWAVVILVVVVHLLRRRRIRERHAVWWLVAGVLALVIGVFPVVLEWAAALLGIAIPTNLVFFVGMGILFLVSLQTHSELTRAEARIRDLAEHAALLELRVQRLESGSTAEGPEASDSA